jgi:hypothetical protein
MYIETKVQNKVDIKIDLLWLISALFLPAIQIIIIMTHSFPITYQEISIANLINLFFYLWFLLAYTITADKRFIGLHEISFFFLLITTGKINTPYYFELLSLPGLYTFIFRSKFFKS